MVPRRPLSERFYEKVSKETDANGCVLWLGSKNEKGYGKILRGGKNGGNVYAHRASYELSNGDIPHGLFVLHRCDNPSCVNPDHLFLGTHQDNMDDCAAKGRDRKGIHPGQLNGRAKISDHEAEIIRSHTVMSRKQAESIALEMGISWKHVMHIHGCYARKEP